jgi:TolB-like protein
MSDHQCVSPSPDDVRSELERILASDAFATSGRLARLLRFVVERTLAGEGDQLKEYVLGVEVFDRGDQYDPRLDSIVRVEARRLRAKLDEYYRNGGASDPVVIAIPRGGYAAVFETRTGAPVPAAQSPAARETSLKRPLALALALIAATAILALSSLAWRSAGAVEPPISIAVLPFEQHSGTPEDERLAARLTDTVTSELAGLGSVAVVSRTSARQFEGTRTPLRTIAQTLDADLIVEATLDRAGDQIKVTARLVDAPTDRKIWAQVFDASISDIDALCRRVAISAAEAATTRK